MGYQVIKRTRAATQATETKKQYDTDNIWSSSVNMYSPGIGKNHIRILPRLENPSPPEWLAKYNENNPGDIWGLTIQSVSFGPNRYLSSGLMLGDKSDPLYKQAKKESYSWTEGNVNRIKIRTNVICWVLDRNERPDPTTGFPTPKIWIMPFKTVSQNLASLSLESSGHGEPLLFEDYEKGYDIKFKKEGQGLHTTYSSISIGRDAGPAVTGEGSTNQLLDFLSKNHLEDKLQFKSNSDLEEVLLEVREMRADVEAAGGQEDEAYQYQENSPPPSRPSQNRDDRGQGGGDLDDLTG